MSLGAAAFSPSSLLTKASDAASLDPTLLDQSQRRRALWSFLTWAFCLSDAFKTAPADAWAVQAPEDPDGPTGPNQDAATTPSPMADDEPALKDWSVAFPGETIGFGLGTHGLQALPGLTRFDGPELLLDASAPHVQSVVSAGGGSGRLLLGEAELNAGFQTDVGADADAHGAASPLAGSAPGLSIGLEAIPLDVGVAENAMGSSVIHLIEDLSGGRLPMVGDSLTVVTTTANGLLSLTQSLLGDALASDGTVSVGALPIKLDLGTDDLFAGGRYTDYHLALQLEGPDGRSVVTPAPAADHGDGLALDNLIPHATPEPGAHGDAGVNLHGLGLPTTVDDLVRGVELLL